MRLRTIFKRKDPKDGSNPLAAGGATVAAALGAIDLNRSPTASRDNGAFPAGHTSVSLDR